jgi:transcriptional regulator with GAF, ATPase, and Fis domain
VIVFGESGTGKELVAQAIHEAGKRGKNPFVKVNCAALNESLLESELFGHVKGAFTGAIRDKKGRFELAHGGTIFLDEIGDMSLPAQAKVLRVLQTGELSRVGGEEVITTDCRVVAATNKDLEQAVSQGEFREDLFFRLNVLPIHSPSLRERLEDIPLLCQAFVAECCDENGFSRKELDDSVLGRLQAYDWPGNVRELRNVIERVVILSDDVITERDLPPYLGGPGKAAGEHRNSDATSSIDIARYSGQTLREFREEVECEFIRHKLAEFEWNISRTAQALGIERTNLHKKMRALGIKRGGRS